MDACFLVCLHGCQQQGTHEFQGIYLPLIEAGPEPTRAECFPTGVRRLAFMHESKPPTFSSYPRPCGCSLSSKVLPALPAGAGLMLLWPLEARGLQTYSFPSALRSFLGGIPSFFRESIFSCIPECLPASMLTSFHACMHASVQSFRLSCHPG